MLETSISLKFRGGNEAVLCEFCLNVTLGMNLAHL